MTRIAVDIDDTLYSFNDLAREVFVDVALEHGDRRLQRGAYCAWGEWRSPADVTDDDIWPYVIDRCHSAEHILSRVPFPRAAQVLQDLVAQDYGLHYISNRDPETWHSTYQWLYDHDFPIGPEIELTCNYKNKLPQMRGCQYLIDDRPRTLVEFVYEFHWKHRWGSENKERERKAFGLYMPHNAALTDVPGIKLAPNWKLLRQYLIDQEVLRSPVGTAS